MTYQSLNVRPVTACLGAEIEGVDLRRPSNQQLQEIADALAEHQVIFFRDQELDHDSHKAFGRAFGPLAIHSGVSGLPDHPEVVRIHADADSDHIAGENWHTDLSADAEPPMGSILYLHTVPPAGGDTLFASMYAAYDTLSDRMKTYLEGLQAVHDANHVYRALYPDVEKTYPTNPHPIVRTHPVTKRKCLFINPSHITHIVGMPKAEGKAILEFLYEHCNNPNFQVRFRWRPHSVAFWDNRCTQHMATWDYFPQTRSGYRVTVGGDKPY